jgi:hypothetical protein
MQFSKPFLRADGMLLINRDAFLSTQELFKALEADAAFGFFTFLLCSATGIKGVSSSSVNKTCRKMNTLVF